jgi:hypothetical protein
MAKGGSVEGLSISLTNHFFIHKGKNQNKIEKKLDSDMILILSGNHTKCLADVAPSSDYTLGEWSPLNHDGLLLSFISSSIDTKTNTLKLCVLVIVLFS